MQPSTLASAFALTALSTLTAGAQPALTIYNQNFAVVRDAVPLDLKQGVNDVRFTETTAHLEPDSVILRDPQGKMNLQVLEQNYRNDPISQELLLSMFDGKTIEFLVNSPNDPSSIVSGKVNRRGAPVQAQAPACNTTRTSSISARFCTDSSRSTAPPLPSVGNSSDSIKARRV